MDGCLNATKMPLDSVEGIYENAVTNLEGTLPFSSPSSESSEVLRPLFSASESSDTISDDRSSGEEHFLFLLTRRFGFRDFGGMPKISMFFTPA